VNPAWENRQRIPLINGGPLENRMSEKDVIPWLVLNRFGVENLRGWTLLWKKFGSAERIFDSDWDEFKSAGLTRSSFQKMKKLLPVYRQEAEREVELSTAASVSIITPQDERYPALLKYIYDPPFVLYCKGHPEVLAGRKTVAIVGSRMASIYGRNAARKIGRDLADQGILVVSGGAAGIDTEAHLGALEAGMSAAVLGSGIDVVYPKENAGLFGRIAENGVVVSEFPFGTPPDRYNFPRRNRLISGLSYGVVVVEAAKRSGSLITANFAMEQGRDVFAVPGEIGAHFSEGTNNLIKQGGKLVEGALDILEALVFEKLRPADSPPFDPASPEPVSPEPASPAQEKKKKQSEDQAGDLTELEKAVLSVLDAGLKPVDFILEKMTEAGYPVKDVESGLLTLELKGLVRQAIGKRFERT